MYVSRLLFHTVPGKTREIEQELKKLRDMVSAAGGTHARILPTHRSLDKFIRPNLTA
jgi:hypothetical protein